MRTTLNLDEELLEQARHSRDVVSNTRSLLLPWVRVVTLPGDSERRHGYRPKRLETPVGGGRFMGTRPRIAA